MYKLKTLDLSGCTILEGETMKYLHAAKNVPFLKKIVFDYTNVTLPYGKDIKINQVFEVLSFRKCAKINGKNI